MHSTGKHVVPPPPVDTKDEPVPAAGGTLSTVPESEPQNANQRKSHYPTKGDDVRDPVLAAISGVTDTSSRGRGKFILPQLQTNKSAADSQQPMPDLLVKDDSESANSQQPDIVTTLFSNMTAPALNSVNVPTHVHSVSTGSNASSLPPNDDPILQLLPQH